jgi:hypothetical protein
MQKSHWWIVASLLLSAAVLWFVQPTRQPFELAFLAAACAIGVLAIASPLLLKARMVRSGRVWGDGSIDRPLQGFGVALLAWGGVIGLQRVFVLGAIGLAAGATIEIVRNRRHRLT